MLEALFLECEKRLKEVKEEEEVEEKIRVIKQLAETGNHVTQLIG